MPKEKGLRIACIGWGSLIDNPGCLATLSTWGTDGPLLPVEFARESADGRITLVICPTATRVPTRWILLNQPDIQSAKENLGFREYRKATPEWINKSIGFWDREEATQYGMESETISAWGAAKGLDGVVWTNLSCGFKASRDTMPTFEEVQRHFLRLNTVARGKAEAYVRNAPTEVDTAYRREITANFGWG